MSPIVSQLLCLAVEWGSTRRKMRRCSSRRKGFRESSRDKGIEVVLDDANLFRIGIDPIKQEAECAPHHRAWCAPLHHFHMTPTARRCNRRVRADQA